MAERVRAHPESMRQRKAIVEHSFGTMKRAMNQGYFLLRGQPQVRAELRLTVLAYNIKRVIAILGVPAMIAAVGASGSTAANTIIVAWWILARMIMVIWGWNRAIDREFSHGLALHTTA